MRMHSVDELMKCVGSKVYITRYVSKSKWHRGNGYNSYGPIYGSYCSKEFMCEFNPDKQSIVLTPTAKGGSVLKLPTLSGSLIPTEFFISSDLSETTQYWNYRLEQEVERLENTIDILIKKNL